MQCWWLGLAFWGGECVAQEVNFYKHAAANIDLLMYHPGGFLLAVLVIRLPVRVGSRPMGTR